MLQKKLKSQRGSSHGVGHTRRAGNLNRSGNEVGDFAGQDLGQDEIDVRQRESAKGAGSSLTAPSRPSTGQPRSPG